MSGSSLRQNDLLSDLTQKVLGRRLTSDDLREAYEHAGLFCVPEPLPDRLNGLQASRLIQWLLHLKTTGRMLAPVHGVDPCIYCAFGCDLCEPELGNRVRST